MDYNFENTIPSEKNLQLYSQLLSLVFPDTKKYTPAFLNWQYNLNPAGKVVGYDAFYDGELAAHYVTIPVVYEMKGQKINGLLSLNTATHPKHQGKKLFTRLAERTYQYAQEQGYQFVIGVANQNSTHGFTAKLGFKFIAPLQVTMYLGKTNFSSVSQNYFQANWNEELVKWRLSNPGAAYFKNNNSVICDTHISLIKAVLSQKPDFSKNDLLHKNALVKMTIGLNQDNKNLFKINLPDKHKPSPLNLILKTLCDFKTEIAKTNIFFELIDFDAY